MKVLNVGALELIFIILLALIVLGPKKAVKAAGDVGGWVRKFLNSQLWKDLRSASREIQDFPKKMMDEAEIQKTLDEIDRSAEEVNKKLMDDFQNSYKRNDQEEEEKILPPDIKPQKSNPDN